MQQDTLDTLDEDLSGLKPAQWQARMAALAEENGMYQPLGNRHFASFIDQGNTLLVSFETIQGIHNLSDVAQPLGFDLVKNLGWSHLCIISNGDTWFRNERIYGFFDQLIDDGFFDEFDKVVFYGAGPCGYAAAAFSVAAPGATVVAVQPQATLDPRLTDWDDRFSEMRRVDFTDRYGFAPDMMDAAKQGFVIYDPRERLDSMHAALFARKNVLRLRTPHLGDTVQTRLIEMEILYNILALAGADRLTERQFYKLYRARRSNGPYLRKLMARLEQDERPYLMALLCRNVTSRLRAPRFRRRLEALRKSAAEGQIKLPPER
ncbi:phosphoadenosine phosphosulfate reductase [Phaeobacter inhibens]|uniref:phosphoadenosine phosphosulfate reductase n=1 Tax=Phaeobacter inhibens TaxID=221822 RepID=UPI000C9A386A|nr:phosphoadenosine phosphosulfate reductase [Phaeobacter inhibens]AUQ53773.1 Glycosyl transferase family 2 [Phaeobacter inhibens]AUQ62048.1 Glycosyl transferase family 2 [Phaeobacter inhibens]AUQ77789.1 Glycosyl transferase family 2 [Phaeobacter inhibens]AUQ82022.1 Glycosyl transferase family 2 [Phaeobacter inhibens]AUQ89745.1 Glycosyl transferase family 2 [Phaeobacter inhibens]